MFKTFFFFLYFTLFKLIFKGFYDIKILALVVTFRINNNNAVNV